MAVGSHLTLIALLFIERISGDDLEDSSRQQLLQQCTNETINVTDGKPEDPFHNSTTEDCMDCDEISYCPDKNEKCQQKCMGHFSNMKSMIKNDGFLVVAWIISLTALTGNLTVIGTSLRVLYRRGRLNKEQKIIKLLFLSLAISDLILAVYTFAICAMASRREYIHTYCRHDQTWRKSSSCTGLGVMFVIGSEQSVLTMMLIALTRVRAMRKPFSRPPIERVVIALVIAWIVSILIAVIPLLPSLEDSFKDVKWSMDDKRFCHLNKARIERINKRLLTEFGKKPINSSMRDNGSLSLLLQLTNNTPFHDNVRSSGFYSHHSVCIPALYTSYRHSPTWWYTNIVIVVNFLAFITMVIGYIYIYKERQSTENRVENMDNAASVSGQLQMKIMLILLTDFCCWIPVCFASFVRLAGQEIPKYFYLPTALIVLPINSALNPFIYSGAPKYLWNKTRPSRAMIHQVCLQPLIKRFRTGNEPEEQEET